MTRPRPGDLRRRITIEQPLRVDDEGGTATVTWQAVASVWARIEGLGGDEALNADADRAHARVRVTMRYRNDVTPGMRIIVAGSVHDIVSAQDQDGRRRWLVCTCEVSGP